MNTPEIVQRYLAMDGLGVTTDGLLFSLDESITDKMPRLLVLNHEQGYSLFPRHNLPAHLRGALMQISPEHAFHDHERIKAVLAADTPCPEVWTGRSYTFPALRAEDYPFSVVRLSEAQRDLIVKYDPNLNLSQVIACTILADGQIVVACVSSRENAIGAEAWVQTLPAYRRRGYARQVTTAWAFHLQQEGKIPFYSHHSDNLPSHALAQELRLKWFMSDAVYR